VLGLEVGETVPDREEDVLCDVSRGLRVADSEQRIPIDPRVVSIEERSEGIAIAGPGVANEVELVVCI
jgi:hypothetical protein